MHQRFGGQLTWNQCGIIFEVVEGLKLSSPTVVAACFRLGRWERRQHSIRAWPAVVLCSSSTPTGEESEGPQPSRHNTDNLREDGDSSVCLDSGRNGDASSKDGAGRSGGRVASGASISGNLRLDLDDWPTKSTKVSRGSGNSIGGGRLRLKWGVDIDIQVTT